MENVYSIGYFHNQLRKLRLAISHEQGYQTIDELFFALQHQLADVSQPYLQNQGNEK